MSQSRPLEGLRVVELGQLLAGPFAGTVLGYFGAEVIKVEPPTGDVALRMDCGWPCSGAVDLTPVLKTMDAGEWNTVSVPVACFARRGVDLSRVNTPFLIATRGALTVDIAEIAIREVPMDNTLFDCDGLVANP